MQKAYDNAINQYTIAAGIKPDEEYPLKRIYDITKIIEANVVVDVTKVAEIVQSNNLVRYEFNPVPRQGRRESYIILKTKKILAITILNFFLIMVKTVLIMAVLLLIFQTWSKRAIIL